MVDLSQACRWLEHDGNRILHVSYGGCSTDQEMLKVLAEQVRLIQAEGHPVRVIHDYRNAFLGERFVEESKRLSKERRERSLERVAVVGLRGIQKALFLSYRVFSGDHTSQLFDSVEDALRWLTNNQDSKRNR